MRLQRMPTASTGPQNACASLKSLINGIKLKQLANSREDIFRAGCGVIQTNQITSRKLRRIPVTFEVNRMQNIS
jgi:hypothetical protein